MKQPTILAALLTIVLSNSYSQQQKIILSLGSGPAFAGGQQKNNLQGNGYSVQADGFVSFYRKGWDGTVKGGSIAFGFNAGINYTSPKNLQPGMAGVSEKYPVYNGQTTVSNSSEKKYSNIFSTVAGLQAQISINRFIISPIINSGYMWINQSGYTQTGELTSNGRTTKVGFAKQDAVNTSGVLIKPQVKIGYLLSERIQLYLASAFTSGPKVDYQMYTLVPKGGFNEKNIYEPDQLKNGSYAVSKTTTRYTSGEIHIGISLGLGKGIHENGVQADALQQARKKPRGKVTKPGDNGMLHAMSADTTKNPLYNGPGRSQENPLYQGMAKPGQPIGGIVVKGGRNPDGNLHLLTNGNGEITFTATEAGEYKLQLTNADDPLITTGSSVNERRVEVLKSNKPGDPNPPKNKRGGRTYTGGRKNEVAQQDQARPGTPIGGIIVKGGKNPGGNSFKLVTTANGEITFLLQEPGEYTFRITAPETPATSATN